MTPAPGILLVILLVLISNLCGPQVINGALVPIALTHRAILDQRGNFVMLWTPKKDEIVIEIQVATQGYVGLGFSPNGGMKGSDIVIGWLDPKGNIHFTDRYAKSKRTPTIDDSQDYTILGGYKNSSHTVLRFSRPWTTCDHQNDIQLTDNTVKVIWAYDNEVPKSGATTLQYHDHRGVKNLYLKDPKTSTPPQGTNHWDVVAPNIPLPENMKTVYWCQLFKAPPMPRKTHFIGYKPIIQELNTGMVHHMILYECKLSESERHFEKWISIKGAQCYNDNMPVSWNACSTPIIAWAIGSDGEMLPEHVGFPMGDEHGGSTYFLLETHYNNDENRKGIFGNSGVRIFLTENLRKHEAGVITIGHKVEPTHIIPPKEQAWESLGHCTSHCTQATLPYNGIRVFSGVLHAHVIGTGIALQQIRRGRELPPIFNDMQYAFNYQQARILDEERIVLPGDHLIAKCTYDSSKRINPTFGGFATEDEMCLVFVSYYPRQDIIDCYSRPDINIMFLNFGIRNLHNKDEVMKSFGSGHFDESYISEIHEEKLYKELKNDEYLNLNNATEIHLARFLDIIKISEPPEMANQSFYNVMMTPETWSESVKKNYQEVVSKHPYEPNCLYHGRKTVPGIPKKAKYPTFAPYYPIETVCSDGIPKESYSEVLPASKIPKNTEIINFGKDGAALSEETGGSTLHRPDDTLNYLAVEPNQINHQSPLKKPEENSVSRLSSTWLLYVYVSVFLVATL